MKFSLRSVLFTLIFILLCPPKNWAGDSRGSYGIDELVQRALETSRQLKLLDEDIARSRMELKNAKTSYFPHLTLQGSAGVDLLSLGSFEPENNLGSDLILDWNFFQNGLVFYRVEQAKAQVELSILQRKREAAELAYQIQTKIINLVEIEARIRLGYRDVALAKKMLEKTQFESKQGRLKRADLLKAQIQVYEKRNHLGKMRKDRDSAIEKLKTETGIPVTEELKIKIFKLGKSLKLSKETCLKLALENRTEVREGEIQLMLSKKAVHVAKLGRLPRLDLFAGNAFALDDFERSTDQFQFRTGVIARYPLYDGGQTKLQIILAQMASRKAEYQWDESKRKVMDEAQRVFDEWIYAQGLLKSGKNQFKMMKKELEESILEFKQGNLSSLELDEARVALEQAKIYYLGLRLGVLRAEALLTKALGLLSLASIPN